MSYQEDKNDLTNGEFEKDPEGVIERHKDDFKTKKVMHGFGWLITGIVSLIWIIIFVLVLMFTSIDNTKLTDSYLSNVTNTSMVRGYLTGYQVCQENMINLINDSRTTCQLIRANINGESIELVPITCLNNVTR